MNTLSWKHVAIVALLIGGAVALEAFGAHDGAVAIGAVAGREVLALLTASMRGNAPPPAAPTALALLVALAVAASACANPPPPASPSTGWEQCAGGPCYSPDSCDDVRESYLKWGLTAYLSAGAAGVGGVVATRLEEDSLGQLIVIGVAAGLTALTGGAIWMRDERAGEQRAFCSRPPPLPAPELPVGPGVGGLP